MFILKVQINTKVHTLYFHVCIVHIIYHKCSVHHPGQFSNQIFKLNVLTIRHLS